MAPLFQYSSAGAGLQLMLLFVKIKYAVQKTYGGLGYKILLLLFLVCVSFTIIGQPRNSVLIRRVYFCLTILI